MTMPEEYAAAAHSMGWRVGLSLNAGGPAGAGGAWGALRTIFTDQAAKATVDFAGRLQRGRKPHLRRAQRAKCRTLST
jgi:hypothetical protein